MSDHTPEPNRPDADPPVSPPAASAPTPAQPAEVRRERDLGTPVSLIITWILAIACYLTVAVMQNSAPPTPAPTPNPEGVVDELTEDITDDDPADLAQADDTNPLPGSPMLDIAGKLFVKTKDFLKADPNAPQQVRDLAQSPGDKARSVVIIAEIADAETALNEIESLRSNERHADNTAYQVALDTLETVYTEGPDTLDPEQAERLQTQLGVFGDIALTHGLDDTDPARAPYVTGGLLIAFVMLAFLGTIGVAFLTGLTLLIVGAVMATAGKLRLRFIPPHRGGSVYLEMFALFVGGFLAIKLAFDLFFPNAPIYASFGAQWSLLLVMLWPVVRGVPLGENFRKMGFHRGQGVFREIACGFVGYLASLPIYAAAIGLVLLFMLIKTLLTAGTGEPPAPPSNPIFDIVQGAPIWVLALFFLTATIWAPLLEEAVFRGALLRHLSPTTGIALAGLIAAVLFAFMHNYGPLFTPPLIALGFSFALMRAWRGSLIAAITAHFIHNAFVLTMVITVVSLVQ